MTKSGPAIGIDLGTTFSVIATLDASGKPTALTNAEGDITTPSVVFFDHRAVVVGKEAVKASVLEPGRTVQFVKREMGRSVCSQSVLGEYYPPEVIQSLILEKLRKDAEARIGKFKDAVITVPAYFDEPRRKATQDAGRLAGLNVVDIINEPTAAALSYGVMRGFLTPHGESDQPERILVYDLGGGTFDTTLMEIEGRRYTVLATDGDVRLGGLDWDRRIVDFIADEFQARHQVDVRSDPLALQRLLREAEDAKRALTARESVTIQFEHRGNSLRLPLSREQFEELTADLLDRTRFTVTGLLKHAGVRWKDLTRLLLVGGSTRMPMVARMLEGESGLTADRSLAADEAVAHGAAIYAGLLQTVDETKPADFDFEITNVNAHSLGVLGVEKETGRPRNRVLIKRNTPLPATKTKRFRTYRQDQRSVAVQIIEGGDASGSHATKIGRCLIHDLPPSLPAGTFVDVTFSYTANGRLTVTAQMPSIQREARLDIVRDSGLSDALMDEWGQRLHNGLKPLHLDS